MPSEEILLRGGRIYPLEGDGAVEALLVRDGRVALAGSESQARSAAGRAPLVVELDGATVTPGLVDAHAHPTAWALARTRVDVGGARDAAEAAARVGRASPSVGEWVVGQGWDAHRWGRLPTRAALDHVAPRAPVLLESHDLHAVWVNGEALARCAIDRHTPDPPGGEIVRDPETGEPTGVLLEEARKLALGRIPTPEPADVTAALLDAQALAHRWGVTGLHSVEPTGLADLEPLWSRDLLRLRVLQHLPLDGLDAAVREGRRSGGVPDPRAEPWVAIGGAKMFLDGALGSRTAWLREPYEGSGEYRGLETLPEADFRDAVRLAAGAGLASTVHAIGDAAVERALRILGVIAPPPALPHRIEHLQLCPPELWDRAARSGIVASMQPVHLLTDIPAAERHWGHGRCRGAFAFAPLLRRGMTLAFGSDAPVETLDPRPGLYAAVRRESWAGPWNGGEWYPENGLTIADALLAYTAGPALAARVHHRRGRLLPGHDADLVAWDVDPLRSGAAVLREMRCILTMVRGEIVCRDGI